MDANVNLSTKRRLSSAGTKVRNAVIRLGKNTEVARRPNLLLVTRRLFLEQGFIF